MLATAIALGLGVAFATPLTFLLTKAHLHMTLPTDFQAQLDAITAAHEADKALIVTLQAEVAAGLQHSVALDAANATIAEMAAAVKAEALTVTA